MTLLRGALFFQGVTVRNKIPFNLYTQLRSVYPRVRVHANEVVPFIKRGFVTSGSPGEKSQG